MEWYRIADKITLTVYVGLLKDIYEILENKPSGKSQEDVFLRLCHESFYEMTPSEYDDLNNTIGFRKALTMALGYFHQNLMGSLPAYLVCKNGETSLDVRSKDDTEIAEIKNNDHTMNSDSKKSVVAKLETALKQGKHALLILVNSVKNLTNFVKNPKIEVLNGRDGYAHLSGHKDFYDDLILTLEYTFKNFKTYKQLQEIV